jgi:anti-sigma B factor antagonist
MLNIRKELNGDTLVIGLEGRLDTGTAPKLEGEMRPALKGVSSLVFDLDGLEYISSAGLRVLLTAQKIMNGQGTMVIRNASEEVMEIFDVTGFSGVLSIE